MSKLVRDRLTWLLYLQLGIYGFSLYGFNPSIPLLREEQHVSRTVASLHSTALAVGALGAGVLYPVVVARLGRGRTLWTGIAGVCAGLVVYVSTTVLPVTLTGAFVAGLAGSLVVTGTAAALSDHQGPAGPAAVSEANACAAGLGLLAPLALGVGVDSGLGWRPALLSTLVLTGGLMLLFGRVRFPTDRESAPAKTEHGRDRLPGRYWLAWCVLVLSIAVEFTLAIWASDVLRSHTGASIGVAATGVTALLGGMFAGRLAGARLAMRLSPDIVMYVALGTAAAGFAVFWTSTLTVLAMAGLVVCGLGVALLFPVGIVRAIGVSGGQTDRAAGRSSIAAALAIGGGPFVFGALADVVGPHRASLVVPVLLGAAVVFVWLSRTGEPAPSAR